MFSRLVSDANVLRCGESDSGDHEDHRAYALELLTHTMSEGEQTDKRVVHARYGQVPAHKSTD